MSILCCTLDVIDDCMNNASLFRTGARMHARIHSSVLAANRWLTLLAISAITLLPGGSYADSTTTIQAFAWSSNASGYPLISPMYLPPFPIRRRQQRHFLRFPRAAGFSSCKTSRLGYPQIRLIKRKTPTAISPATPVLGSTTAPPQSRRACRAGWRILSLPEAILTASNSTTRAA